VTVRRRLHEAEIGWAFPDPVLDADIATRCRAGQAQAAIAEALGYSPNTVRSALARLGVAAAVRGQATALGTSGPPPLARGSLT
jgi:hypothetical protein